MISFPFSTAALRVEQPLGVFYVAVLPAEVLLQVAISDVMRATLNPDGGGYTLSGTQRVIQDVRLKQIAEYINRVDAAFPNSVIIAANYNSEFGLDQEEASAIEHEDPTAESKLTNNASQDDIWDVKQGADGCWKLIIPSCKKLAAIIDGQHRLFAFAKANTKALSCELVCSIFLDLPRPFQAQLFATINSTQKSVDKSLTYELFGYNINDETEEYWTPDKLAVFMARKLGTDPNSALHSRIVVAAKRDAALQALNDKAKWRISTAVVVNGIVRLISSNPKRDSNLMRTPQVKTRSVLRDGPKDGSPLRDLYLTSNDIAIYTLVRNFLYACDIVFWKEASDRSYILKTVGVQAIFDILKVLAPEAIAAKNISRQRFIEILEPAGSIDFSEQEYRIPAGSGRSLIRQKITDKINVSI